MGIRHTNAPARRQGRRAPRRLTEAVGALLRAHRPPVPVDEPQGVWVCLTPALASAIARTAARRDGSMEDYRDHPAHAAARGATCVSPATADQWCRDAWQAADEGLIGVPDALLLSAQIDAPGPA